MRDETKKRILSALAGSYSNAADNACRARMAFRGADLRGQYGESGRTRGEILAEYEAEEKATKEALLDFDPTWQPRKW
jgi:hypothetical protein